MFGKMQKYEVRARLILERGASGLTVGAVITQEAKKLCEEGGQNERKNAGQRERDASCWISWDKLISMLN